MKNGFQLSKIRIKLLGKLKDLRFVQNAEKEIIFFEPNNIKTVATKEKKIPTKPESKQDKKRKKDSFQPFNEAKKTENNPTLKKVIITNIPKKCQIWYLDTWDGQAIQNSEKQLFGLGNTNKAVDGILIVFDEEKQYLNVYFIELKSSLPNTELSKIVEKVQHSISRFLLFICLNEIEICLNETEKSRELFTNASMEFKTILFFNNMADKIDISTDVELSTITKAYKKMQTNKLTEAICSPTFETLLGNTPNPFKFIFRDKEEIITISFADLIQY